MVARGDIQKVNIDFGELYAPTVAVSSIRLLAALACEQDLSSRHFDADQAFVQSELEEEVFMQLPQGCGKLSGKVVKPCRSLYGLRQASRQWHNHLAERLRSLGFTQCLADACVFRVMGNNKVSLHWRYMSLTRSQ